MQEMLTAFGKELELREAHDAVTTKTERDQVGYSNKKITGGEDSPTAAGFVSQQDKNVTRFRDPKTRKTLALNCLKYGRAFNV